jgi:MFS transporter, YNFM family, putative membrane transport protein
VSLLNPKLPLGLVGVIAFLGFYAPQPLLPRLAQDFGVGEAAVGAIVSALALGVVLAAPWAGMLSDARGRRSLMLTCGGLAGALTLLGAAAPSLELLLLCRFLQGLVTPGILVSAMAYAAEEFPLRAGAAASAYVSGTVLGGLLGRLVVSGLSPLLGWRPALAAVGALTLGASVAVARLLPHSRYFASQVNPPRLALSGLLRNRALRAAYLVGFGVLFSLVAVFTFICFRLARPPFSLGPAALGLLFTVYLVGFVMTPFAGRRMDEWGPHRMLGVGLTVCAGGAALTLPASLPVVVVGLAVCSSGVFIAQASASSFVGQATNAGRATASGLYLSAYYAGGAAGAVLPAPLWTRGGWAAVVGLVVAVQAVAAAVALLAWRREG